MGAKRKRTTEEIVREVRKFKEMSRRRFNIEKIIMFGSAARGAMGEHSDIDLILVSKTFEGKSFFRRPLGLYSYWKLPYPVDFICLTRKEFERMEKRVSIVSEAVREGIAI